MVDYFQSLPYWILWLGICSFTGLTLLPIWYVSYGRRKVESLRLETTLWRAEKLLQSAEPVNIQISELRNKALHLDFSNERVCYEGKKIKWQIPFNKVKTWRIYDVNAIGNPASSGDEPVLWNAEFKDSQNAYTLDATFIKNSESLELLKAVCVRAFGSNTQTTLEGLRVELAKSERLLHEINSGNINMKR